MLIHWEREKNEEKKKYNHYAHSLMKQKEMEQEKRTGWSLGRVERRKKEKKKTTKQ